MPTVTDCLKGALRWRLPDYLLCLTLFVVGRIFENNIQPFCQDFEWGDPSLSKPVKKVSFPTSGLYISFALVAVVMVGTELVLRWNRSAGKVDMLRYANAWLLVQLYSFLMAFAILNISKVFVGRLRPCFLSYLAAAGITQNTVISQEALCKLGRQLRLSFPSGHAAAIFGGVTPLSLYLIGLLGCFRGERYWAVTVAALPMVLPVAVAISRTTDYHHHFSDVVAGAIIGVSTAMLAVAMSFTTNAGGHWVLRQQPQMTNNPTVGTALPSSAHSPACEGTVTKTPSLRERGSALVNPCP